MIGMLFAMFELTILLCVAAVQVTFFVFKMAIYVCFILPMRIIGLLARM